MNNSNSIEELTNDIDKKVKELEDNEIDTVDKLTDYILSLIHI